MSLQIIFVLVFIFSSCDGKPELPPAIIRCTPTSDACFKSQLQTFLNVLQTNPKSLKVKDIQPMKVKSWTVAPGPKHIKYNQTYKNFRLYNHAFNKVESLKKKIAGNVMTFNVTVSNPEVIGVAEFNNATFLNVTLSSKGQVTYVHEGYKASFNVTGEIVNREKDKYIKLVDLSLQFSASKIVFNIKTNNATHDVVTNNLLNKNWKLAFDDVKAGYEKIYAQAYRDIVEGILAAFPYDSIFLD
ncbi:hypothetical protein PPYR_08630 [Photinus pyralis]|uniref:Lipid-binding serum glycoprotein N-terminal domain-containing protein n=1 Tax=Photinus pyralis TaxID=7054 RepID=A0A1Y1KTB9_PHOPY|nr:circadian clock-controlled protein-like [Photinus pyralis]KAB0797637.1 hypothetical protein PPYR_08630 [Photinus pyralis]